MTEKVSIILTIIIFFLLTACSNPKPVILAPSIEEFTSSSITITVGESVTLNWVVTGTEPIKVSITSLGTRTGNSVTVSPSTTTTYTLVATNSAGETTKDLIITVKPVPIPPAITSFTASSSNITKGQSSTLNWIVTGTEPINISITSLGNRKGSSVSVSPETTTTFTLIAANPAGKVTKDLTITVNDVITKFAAFGDTPYSNSEFPKILNIFNQVATSQMPFIVHVGDIFSGGTKCNPPLYKSRKDLFDQSPVPFLITIGDNEYNDCRSPENALKSFRKIILGSPSTKQLIAGTVPLVQPITVTRQAELLENAAWSHNNIEFIMISLPNLPGNYPLSSTKIKQILNSNLSFLKERFTQATTQNRSAIVLIMQSDPTSCSINVCGSFNAELTSLVKAYGKPVLSINGDNHSKKFQDSGYQSIKHWWHLRPGGYARGWAEVSFSTKNNRFSVKWR